MGLLKDLLARAEGGAAGREPAGTRGAGLPADVTSHAMRAAVRRWYRLYYDDSPRPGYDPSGRLAYTVVTRLVRTVFSEYSHGVSGVGVRAEGLRGALAALDRVRGEALMHCLIGGECLLKPYLLPAGRGFGFTVIRRTAYRVLGRDERGRATGYATCEVSEENGEVYTLVEERRVLPDGRVRIVSRLYRRRRMAGGAQNPSRFMDWGEGEGGTAALGARVPLDTLEKYAALREDVVLPVPLYGTGLVELKMPVANCVDGSADGVSVYAAAAGAIEAAARLEAELCEEFRRAKSRIVASRDMLCEGPNGGRELADDLFVGLDDDPASVGLTIFSPAIREASFLQRKNDYLRTVENIIGLNRGILCEADSVRRTATEISASEGEYNLTVCGIQDAWRECVERVVDCCARLGQMYLHWPAGGDEKPAVDFGDGVLFNRQQAWQEYERMVQNGWLRPEVALAWYFGVDVEDKEAIQRLLPETGACAGG